MQKHSGPLTQLQKLGMRIWSRVYNRQIDREEFNKVTGLMRAQNRQGASHRDGRRFGLKVAEPVENGGAS